MSDATDARIEKIESDLAAMRLEIRNQSRMTRWTIVAVGLAAIVAVNLGARINPIETLAVHQLSPK